MTNGLVRTGLDKPPTLNSALCSSLKMFKIHYCLQVSSLHSNFVYIYEELLWSAQDVDWSTKGRTLLNVTVFHVKSVTGFLEFTNLSNCVLLFRRHKTTFLVIWNRISEFLHVIAVFSVYQEKIIPLQCRYNSSKDF